MPTTVSPSDIGGTVLANTAQKVRALQQREWSARERFDRFYRELLQPYKQQLEEAFYRYFIYPADAAPHWNAVPALQSDVVETLTDQFEETLADLDEETEGTSEEELEEAFLQGWFYGLWDLYQTGQDVGDIEPPDSETVQAVLVGAAIGGLTAADRARRWLGEARLKHRTGLKALIVQESTLPETAAWFDGIAGFLSGRVSGLMGNELHRAFELGQSSVVALFPDLLIGYVWITRQDAHVCAVCAALHMTITELKPVLSTHPSCRCMLIPLLHTEGSTRPIDFDLFLAEWTAG